MRIILYTYKSSLHTYLRIIHEIYKEKKKGWLLDFSPLFFVQEETNRLSQGFEARRNKGKGVVSGVEGR